jgi:hypothetical protein
MAKAFALPLTKKLSFSLHLLFFNIRAAFYKLCTAPFPSVQRYLYFALSRS